MNCRRLRLSALVIIVVTALLGVATPAYAGTLTSASFTASTPYTYTNAQNTRYDWSFTTATTSTLTKVTATAPTGTGGSGRYMALAATNGNNASTVDSVANSITGDIDLHARVTPSAWPTGSLQSLISKYDIGLNQRSWRFYLSAAGALGFDWSPNGTAATARSTGVTLSTTNPTWVRVTFRPDNGSAQNVAAFYTSTDGSSWSQVGSTQTNAGATSIYDSSSPIGAGSNYSSGTATNVLQGNLYYAEVRNGINGTVVNKFDPNDATATQAAAGSWTSSSPQTETWTVNRSGTNQPADIASDLNVGPVTGVPTGGTANYRFIDGTASYYFPTPTSIPASTPCTINLGGFINTATAGSYSSLIKTWDNAGTPAVVDSVTTATLAFTDYSSSQTVSATVDPSFSFNVANQSSVCNGESNFASGAGAAAAVALGHLAASSNVSGGQALSVASNTAGGFVVYVRGTQTTQNLRSAGYNWTDVSGTYASPAALGAGEKFGYTYKDSTASTSVTNPGSATFVKLDNVTTNKVMGSTTSQSGTGCVTFDAQTGSATPAGSYTATVIYTAIPAF